MPIRQLKHKACNSIVTLDVPDMLPTGVPPEPQLYCPFCKRNVALTELTPKGAVCVLFTQK